MKFNILYQDNTSTMKFEMNGKASCGKRTRHFDINLFYVTNLVERKEATIEYCTPDEMMADFFTKPLFGNKFGKDKRKNMNKLYCSKDVLSTGVDLNRNYGFHFGHN